jgi:hypothetical protein
VRSKWLDWRPGVEIIEKSPESEPSKSAKPFSESQASQASIIEKVPEHEPSKPTKPGFDGSVAPRVGTFSITRAGMPQGVILLAPRFAGMGKPLSSVPVCWCCKAPYQLDRLHEWKGRTYAFLEPGCGCLDVPQALVCCGLCVDHCRCRNREDKSTIDDAEAPKRGKEDFGTPQGDGDSR